MKVFLMSTISWLLFCTCSSTEGILPSESTPLAQDVEALYSSDFSRVAEARSRLIASARLSSENRDEIVRRLTMVLDDPRTEQTKYFNAWYASAETLGDLRAVEAINVLVRHLDYTNGVAGLALSHVPAVQALIKIGKPAVPAVGMALSDSRASIRANAARALGGIGGEETVAILEQASKTEKDKTVRFYIEKGLEQSGAR